MRLIKVNNLHKVITLKVPTVTTEFTLMHPFKTVNLQLHYILPCVQPYCFDDFVLLQMLFLSFLHVQVLLHILRAITVIHKIIHTHFFIHRIILPFLMYEIFLFDT